MTTTISKHDLQLQQIQQQQQQLHLQHFAEQQQQPQLQPQQQQRSSILLKPSINASLLMQNTVSQLDNTTKTTTKRNTLDFSTAARTTTRLDSAATTIIQIDSLNNNNTSLNNTTTTTNTTIALTTAATTPLSNLVHIPAHSPSGMNNNNSSAIAIATATVDSPDSSDLTSTGGQPKAQRRRSLLNFKSFDFHIKSLYSGLRNSSKQSQSSSIGADNANDAGSQTADTPGHRTHIVVNNRMPPYLKIEAVDAEESENLLLDYPQSPYSSRRNSSHDDNRSSSQLLHINRYELSSRSQASSPSPYFLSPYATESGNIRRSSTSDIMSCKRSGTSSASDSRRPSTSDLLRRARERRGSEARMGRSVSHGGLPRGGFRSSCGGGGASKGGRRTSMAF